MTDTTRRAVLTGAVTAGAAAALAACADGDGGAAGSAGPGTGQGATGAGAASAGASGGSNGAPAGGLARKADIPVGGGKIFADQDVVITQPVAGTFKGFAAACTHQGCSVTSIRDGGIRCACHGSVFSAADGSVQEGPATSPLPAKGLKIDGDTIALA